MELGRSWVRVLVVDDIRGIDAPDGAEVVIARTAEDGIEALGYGPWDRVYLDHDLGDAGDVRPLVTLLERRAFEGAPVPIERVVVVSNNPPGAEWIAAGLRRHYDVRVRPAGRVI